MHSQETADKTNNGDCRGFVELANYIVTHYGIQRLVADIDRNRQFDTSNIVGWVLDWVSVEGFQTYFEQFDLEYQSPTEFRQRFLISRLDAILRQPRGIW